MLWIILSAAVIHLPPAERVEGQAVDDLYLQIGSPRPGRVRPVLPTETPVLLGENVLESLPVSVVTVANTDWEIVARRTMTPRPPSTHDWW